MDILEASENIIVHQVNEIGVMGAGLALQIKNKYPNVYQAYKKHASQDCWGKIQLVRINEHQWICNMFSQRGISRTKQTTDYELMKQCFDKLAKYAKEHNLTVAVPYGIGCGLAGGSWTVVAKIIKQRIPDVKIYRKE